MNTCVLQKREDAPTTRAGRTKERFMSVFDVRALLIPLLFIIDYLNLQLFSKPSWEELLPPAVPPYQKPYTLLLSIDDLIVTSTWDVSLHVILLLLLKLIAPSWQRKNGWRTAKRPGVDYFLGYLSQFYEIVIFTTQNHYVRILESTE